MKVFSIDGYYNDDKTEFNGYFVAEFDETPAKWDDDEIFFYGLSEDDIKDWIKNGSPLQDFTITSYSVFEENQD